MFGGGGFESFFGGAGGHEHHGGGHGGRGGGGPIDNKEMYDLLGVTKDSTPTEIKKNYRKLALKHHPDKGGDVETFKLMTVAYEILSDPEKRALYDKYGKEGLEHGGGGGGGDASDIFSQFFGGGGGRGRGPSGPKKGEDLMHPLKVSLEDLYNGKTVKLAVNRDVLCGTCDGRGGAAGAEKSCDGCNGRGMKVQLRQIGPGMVQQMQSVCSDCRGAGKTIKESDKCKPCKGKKVKKERKVLEVHIEKGMKHGHKVTFSGEADQAPGTVAGDIIFVIQEKEHSMFQRKATNLILERHISLVEALCGFEMVITHLDGRHLLIKSKPGDVTTPNQLKSVNGEGMPTHGNPFVKGELVIVLKVDFPSSNELTETQKSLLEKVFKRPSKDVPPEDSEECFLNNFDASAAKAQAQAEAYDSDDERSGGGPGGDQRVQCAQQ